MRTTVTLDPDVEALLKRVMRERDVSFKSALNEALRMGLNGQSRLRNKPYQLKPRMLGLRAGINLDKALQIAADLEDEEIIRKMELGK